MTLLCIAIFAAAVVLALLTNPPSTLAIRNPIADQPVPQNGEQLNGEKEKAKLKHLS